MSFMQEYRAGRVAADSIDDWVDQWHNARPGSPAAQVDLQDWLGMTWPQYSRWIATGTLDTP